MMVFLAVLVAGCGQTSGAALHRTSPGPKPYSIIPASAGLLGGTTPAPNGVLWVLAATDTERTLQQIDLASKSDLGVVPAPASASAVAESATGVLGVGVAAGATGALEIRNGTTGALVATVPVGAPVRSVAAGDRGDLFYVLEGGAASASVSVINAAAGQVQATVPVPLHAVAAIPDPGQDALWVLQPNGLLDEVVLAGGKITTQFTFGYSGRALALSTDGNTLYVLKGTGSIRNVAVVDLATETVRRVLPAPADAVGLVLSADGSTLYDFVGTPTVGNIQAFSLGS